MSGAAFAEVSLSGSAEMGIAGGDTHLETEFHQDIDVTFKLSGETDNGLSFGAAIDLDESWQGDSTPGYSCSGSTSIDCDNPAMAADNAHGGVAVFISGSFGTLTLGDTDGAFDKAMKEAIIGGTIDDVHEHAGYDGNAGLDGTHDGQILRYDYSFDAFTASVSVEQDDGNLGNGSGDNVLGLGVAGSFGDIGFGLGFQDDGTNDIVGLSLDAMFGDIQAIANWSDHSVSGSHVGLAVGYTSGPLLVAANWGDFDSGADGVGVVVNYDLGGGAEVQFGYASETTSGGVDNNDWSLGIAMSF